MPNRNKRNKKFNNAKFRYRRRKRTKNMFRSITYATNYKPQTLGVGRTNLNIERFVTRTGAAEQIYYKIGELLNGSFEFVQKMTQYRYFKIKGIAVVFEPNVSSNVAQRIYVQMNWDGNETDNMNFEDSTKIVPAYRTRRIVLKFLPPNMTLNEDSWWVNYKSWLTRSIYNGQTTLPGNIIVKASQADFEVSFRIILRIAFAGGVAITPSSALTAVEKFKNIVNNMKIEEINKYEDLKEFKKKLDEDKKATVEEEKEEEEDEDSGDYIDFNDEN